MAAMQKIFLIEDTEVRQTGQGKTYGVVFALAKTTSYRKLHEVHIPSQFTAKFAASKGKFLLIKNYSQKEEGLIRIAESSMVIWYSLNCFLDVLSLKKVDVKARLSNISVNNLIGHWQ